jgi:tRNA modification GTPase
MVLSEVFADSTPLDEALVVWFQGDSSYTGEDSAEFSLHGSPFILKTFLASLHQLGVRAAEPGEFTRRAYLNGKLDLTQAEAVADLIHAETEAQARLARSQLQGRLSRAIDELGSPLRNLLAEIEAYIDFPEEDISPLHYSQWSGKIEEVRETLARYISSYSSGRLYREGASVVLVGLPNAGKSSLLNALLGEERVIVTPIPGTTRDSIRESLVLGDGLLVHLWDTAGLAGENISEHRPDAVETIGIEQSWRRAKEADLLLYLFDSTLDLKVQDRLLKQVKLLDKPTLFLGTKKDLPESRTDTLENSLYISAKSGDGLNELKQRMTSLLLGEKRENLLITTQRHHQALKRAEASLIEALGALSSQTPPEFISISVRAALVALEEIVGVTTTDQVLGLIFSKFCIGK